MAEFRDQVAGLLQDGREPCTDDEVRVEHEAETKRMWLPKGKRTKLYVDRKKASRSFIGALSLTTKKMRIHPIEGNQNAEQTRPHDGSPPELAHLVSWWMLWRAWVRSGGRGSAAVRVCPAMLMVMVR